MQIHKGYDYFTGDITATDYNFMRDFRIIFVFGSNLKGIHGSGSAKVAKEVFGAKIGLGTDYPSPLCYAIPTKETPYKSLSLAAIESFVDEFKREADFRENTDGAKFLVTRIGCGLAGYDDDDIAPMFIGSPNNCIFDLRWRKYLE